MGDGFYASRELEWVEFKSGFKVALKKEMDAGDQSDLEDEMMALSASGPIGSEGESSEESKVQGSMAIRPGNLKLLELNVVKVLKPDGTEETVTPGLVRGLSRGVMGKLLKRIKELNRPLSVLESEA